MKFKRAGFLTKLVVVVFVAAAVTALLNLRIQLVQAEAERQAMTRQVKLQAQENAALQAAIDGANDPERIAAIARTKLGLASPGEIIFYDASN